MALFARAEQPRSLSVSDASARGVAGLVKDAERGDETVVERHGRPVAVVVSVDHFDEYLRARADLQSAALVLARQLTDSGARTSLDDAFSAFGLDRAELEAELDAGRED